MTPDAKRDELREKIEAGERRHAARDLAEAARDAAESATEFVKKHPLATLGGAIAIGLVIGAMTKPGRQLTRRGGKLATLVADAAIAYGVSMLEKAGEAATQGQDKLEDLGDALDDKRRTVRREAAHLASTAADRTRSAKRRVSRKTERAVRDLRTHFTS
ncbi:hypothetical protein [Altererythrobacter sp.]|uniref:hypothetical protein n=1 Tax=Altererythrobacter sp. TaxID=1872480 RepID=UPI003CFD8F80